MMENSIRLMVAHDVHELSGDSAADLMDRLRRMGLVQRDESGEVVARSTSTAAHQKLIDALHSREPALLTAEELDSVRAALEQWAQDIRGGFSAMPDDLVSLRHAIVDLR